MDIQVQQLFARFLRQETAQATLEWALLILPCVLFLFIPIELAMRQRTVMVQLNALNYGVWEKATNQTGDGEIIGDMRKIVATNVKFVNPQMDSIGFTTSKSTEVFKGNFSSIYGTVWDIIAFSTFLDKDNYHHNTMQVKFESDLTKRLSQLYRVVLQKPMDHADDLINFKRTNTDQMIGDPWLARWTAGGAYNRKTAEDNVLDQWGIPGIAVLDTLKNVYKSALATLEKVYRMAEDVVNAVFDFGDPWFLNASVAYGLPWGRIELDKVPYPE